jgi:hypothetical protein
MLTHTHTHKSRTHCRALDECFPPGCGVRIIAEPGRYFAETSATLFTTILGHRASRAPCGAPLRDYHLSDGTYGSFRIQVGGAGVVMGGVAVRRGCFRLACNVGIVESSRWRTGLLKGPGRRAASCGGLRSGVCGFS